MHLCIIIVLIIVLMQKSEYHQLAALTSPPPPPIVCLFTVRDVIPLLTESREIQIERPITRTDAQTVILKTSHLCQWLESVASYFVTINAQSYTMKKGVL